MIAVQRFRAVIARAGDNHFYPDDLLQKALSAAFATMYGVRKPVSLAEDSGGDLTVSCDDGTVWRRLGAEWKQLEPPIPGTVADGGGVPSPLHTKLGQIREVINRVLADGVTVAEIQKILDAP